MNDRIIYYVWLICQVIIGYNLITPLILFLLSRLRKDPSPISQERNPAEADYGIIVTAYEETALIPQLVDSLLSMNYSNFIVYIVADNCDVSDLTFENERIVVLRPEKIIASNIGSHFYAINRFKRNHERLTIIDSDNLVDKNYLNELNKFFDNGYQGVQGIRKPKNLDTTYSSLDALRDVYYHFYDGKILFRLGSSSTLSGSGMAFSTDLYEECLRDHEINKAGFDKVLQFEIVSRGLRIAFAEKAIVYDEKTSKTSQLVKQRSRWIYTWFKYFNYGFKLIGKGFRNFNWNQFVFGITLLRPPLFIFLIMSVITMFLNFLLNPVIALIWALALLIYVISFIIPFYYFPVDKRIKASMVYIPSFIYFQVAALFKVKSIDQGSIATKHFHKDKSENIK
ncbi:MAG: glycosyltransferase [Bacteroidota bacterium]